MLAHDAPDDFVIATGRSHTVAQLCELAFSVVGLDWRKYVETTEEYYRPAEVHALVGDASKARRTLGWEPQRSFDQLIEEMVLNDLALLAR
jgi:GDPmannose 4,6-dehydratase